MTEIDYAARVQRGAALLDEKWPTWATDVDLGRLDIWSSYHCATAQYAQHKGMEPYYTNGQELLGLSDREYIAHGFNLEADPETGEISQERYAPLTAIWRSLILQRRSAALSPEVTE